ncbi:MAG: hypothetical protein NVS9B15_06570 [Acidobacteriaceae bacterium]
MQPADIHGDSEPRSTPPVEHDEAPVDLSHLRTHFAWILSLILVVLLLVFIPPLINVSRFQRRIASNLSAAIGRPVHLDRVRLSLLPLPGFTLENFVVDEDPAFGYEPILRANQVRATVRISSLWSHRVEFSRISLTETTSVNLVHLPNGHWNFEPVLIQASHMEAAPTAQTYSGPTPRFPYIEASGARLNVKLGDTKIPLALTDSDFALWLPVPGEWHFRLEAHPARTDVAPADVGLLRLEGTLGDPNTRAASLGEVPIDLRADWQAAPLAGLMRLAIGRDVGLRGNLTLSLHANGTAGHAALVSDLKFAQLRRSDFIPAHLISFEAGCEATVTNSFQTLSGVECHWPPANSSNPAVLIVSGSVLDVHRSESAKVEATFPALPAAILLDWIQAATPHSPNGLTGSGVLSGKLAWNPADHAAEPDEPAWSGELELAGESMQLPSPEGSHPIPLGDMLLRSTSTAAPASRPHMRAARPSPQTGKGPGFDLLPVTIPLGGRQPATLEGHFDLSGYTLHLTGSAELSQLLALAGAIPQFGDGLPDALTHERSKPAGEADAATPLHLDLTATRIWGHPQTWTQTGSSTFAPSQTTVK